MYDLLVTLLNLMVTFSGEITIALLCILLLFLIFREIRAWGRRKTRAIQDALVRESILKENAINKDKTLKQLKEERLRIWNQEIREEVKEEPKEEPKEDTLSAIRAPQLPYKRRKLLTKPEYEFYQILKAKCDEAQYIICPKVRLEDIAGVDEEQIESFVKANADLDYEKEKERYREYVKSKHIDFMICDKKLRLLAGVELDGDTHLTPEEARKDEFKNKLFFKIYLPLYRAEDNPDKYEGQIDNIIRKIQENQEKKRYLYWMKQQSIQD